jgi:hypothetical protein
MSHPTAPSLAPLPVSRLCTLAPAGGRALSAASGLVQLGPWLHVVADDGHHLLSLPAPGEASGAGEAHEVRLFPGDLPETPAERKRQKPDLEALALLPPAPAWPHGALLALGSGSTAARHRAVLAHLGPDGRVRHVAPPVDLSALHGALARHTPSVNLEGALVLGDRLLLLNRGNGKDAQNLLVPLPLAAVVAALAEGRAPGAELLGEVRPVALGAVDGVPLSLTDGAPHPSGRGLLVSAVAEDTEDAYRDGPCVGSVLAHLSEDGKVLAAARLEGGPKVEGVAPAAGEGGAVRVRMVTDADDPEVAAELLETRWGG